MSFRTFMIMQKRAWISLFARRPRVVDDVLHPPIHPGHPSLLCKCDNSSPRSVAYIEHKPNCEWLRAQCRSCRGEGTCERCGGDGVDPKTTLMLWLSKTPEERASLPSAIKLTCCHLHCSSIATWGFWTGPRPDDVNYACDTHLGALLPDDSSSHHETTSRINVWSLDRGYDPTHNSAEAIEDAVRSETGAR